uniref:Uncharacterized protein n=1 Tax=Candidatus Kentrum sp. TC TaxID=2126339 RepID=A0A450YJM9_9GAMM|nr:MAG: hypothetical protein BECKTC1821E_GA0114239_101344 [Candidatus Kentron sp. TC]
MNLIPGHPEKQAFLWFALRGSNLGYELASLIGSASGVIATNNSRDPRPPRFIFGFSFMIGGGVTSLHEL